MKRPASKERFGRLSSDDLAAATERRPAGEDWSGASEREAARGDISAASAREPGGGEVSVASEREAVDPLASGHVSPAGVSEPGDPRAADAAPPLLATDAADPGPLASPPASPGGAVPNMLPGRERRRFRIERLLTRLIATCGVVGIGVAIAAIMVSSKSEGWIIGLVVSLVSVVLSAILWSSRQL